MGARTGQQFLDGLRKTPRQLWLGDERVDDVTGHPALAGAARTAAQVFDRQHRFAGECLVPDPETGEPINISHAFPGSAEDLKRRNQGLARIAEATASTMASMAEALGMTLPGNAAIPAPDSRRLAMAELAGRRAVEMAKAGGPRPGEILTAQAFDNAIRTLMAIGGSTNAVIHLLALAGRVRVPLSLARFDELSPTTPFVLNVRPSGKHLMEDFF